MPTNRRRPRRLQAGDQPALDPRKAAILEAVVTEYIGTAQPVGSQHVASAPGIDVSSATVRAEMVALEHEGYLVQPHTSAGPRPTRATGSSSTTWPRRASWARPSASR
jgi:hypothetical protein